MRQFRTPEKSFRPMVRWWWPGDDVTDQELRREVGLLDEANFGGAEIQSFTDGLLKNMPQATRNAVYGYQSPAYFHHVATALEAARQRGMWLDYTFGSAWPFGGPEITPELASVELRCAHQTIQGPVHFHGKILLPEMDAKVVQDATLPAGWAERLRQRQKLVAVVATRGTTVQYYPSQPWSGGESEVEHPGELESGSSTVITSHLSADGMLDWDVPQGTWQVFAFREVPTGQHVAGGAEPGPQLVLDHMSRKAFDVYAQHVGGALREREGAYFGNTLRAVFADSLEVAANLYWSDDFLEQFRRRRGYDLTPYLPLLEVPGANQASGETSSPPPLYDTPGTGGRVRRDYWQTVSDVMIANLYSPFDEWARKNNLLPRVQAHGSPTDLLRVYGEAAIPETEDLFDNGRYDFLKLASSGADLYGRKIVGSESFVWYGKLYQTTPEKIKRFADELFTAGANEIIYHGFPYSYRDRPFPGWTPFHEGGGFSSDVNETNPFWPYLPRLNMYITRLQYILQTGTTIAPVALYRGELGYGAIYPTPQAITTRLPAAGYNFDDIDAYTLLHSSVEKGKLVSPGGHSFSALLLPGSSPISAALAGQLAEFAKQGLHILFLDQFPQVEVEAIDGHLPAADTHDALRRDLKFHNVSLAGQADAVKTMQASGIEPGLRFVGESLPFIEKRLGALDIFFLRNPGDSDKEIVVDSPAATSAELWDPWGGGVHPIVETAGNVEEHHLRLHFDPYGSLLLVLNPEKKAQEDTMQLSEVSQQSASIDIGKAGWHFHGIGIGPGSRPESVEMALPDLIDWSLSERLKHFSGKGTYTTTFAVPNGLIDGHRRMVLDLGDVENVAVVSINKVALPPMLLQPYRTDVTGLLHPGTNTLQVIVVNTLFNALSADGDSLTYTAGSTNTANSLVPSGLIGPVRLRSLQTH